MRSYICLYSFVVANKRFRRSSTNSIYIWYITHHTTPQLITSLSRKGLFPIVQNGLQGHINGLPSHPNMHPHILNLHQTHTPIPTTLRPHGNRAHRHIIPKGPCLPLRSGPRGPNAKSPLHAPSPLGPLGPLSLRHDNSTYIRHRPPHSLCWAWRILHRRRHMPRGEIQRRQSPAPNGPARDWFVR